MTAAGVRRPKPFRGKSICGLAVLALALGGIAVPDALAETRGYVISMVHTATWANTDTCPQGDNGGLTALKLRRLVGRGFSEEEARTILATGVDADGNRVPVNELPRLNGRAVNPGNVPVLVSDPQIRTARGPLRPRLQSERRGGARLFRGSGERRAGRRQPDVARPGLLRGLPGPPAGAALQRGHRLGHGARRDAGVADVDHR